MPSATSPFPTALPAAFLLLATAFRSLLRFGLPEILNFRLLGTLTRPPSSSHRLRVRIPSRLDKGSTQNDFNLRINRTQIIGSPLGYRLVDCRVQPQQDLFTPAALRHSRLSVQRAGVDDRLSSLI